MKRPRLGRGDRPRGQALVEFSLTLVVLLLFIFIVIEAGRFLQAWLTVQNSARAGLRYAITGQFEDDCLFVFPPCLDPRVRSIEDEARRTASGLKIDPNAEVGEPLSFSTEVWGQDASGVWQEDFAGLPGLGVRVRVLYEITTITPLFSVIVDSFTVAGQVVGTNEEYGQIVPGTIPPDVPPTPEDPPEADVGITKALAPPLPNPGDPPWTFTETELGYSLVITNAGPFDAEDVTVVDVLPPGTEYISSTVSGGGACDLDSGVLSCNLPNLDNAGPPGNTATVQILIRTPAEPGIITNTASVDAGVDTVDPNPANNVSNPVVVEVKARADLSVVKSDSKDPIDISDTLTYTLDVLNSGPGPAINVVLTDTMPPDTQATITGLSWDAGFDSCAQAGQIITCLQDRLEAGATAQVLISSVPVTEGINLLNTAVVTTTVSIDEFPANNTDTEDTVVLPVADLAMTKTGPENVLLGEVIVYTLSVTNNGPSRADQVVVTDSWNPAGLVSFVAGGSPTCTDPPPAGGPIQCTTLQIQPGDTFTWTAHFQTNFPSGDALVNAAAADSLGEADDVPSNNADSVQTFIHAADLSVIKMGPPLASINKVFTYTLLYANNGPSLAPGVVITDDLPNNVTAVSYPPTCSLAADILTCGLGDLTPGTSQSFQISVLPTSLGTAVNNVSIASTGGMPDQNPANNSDSVSTTITQVDLELTKDATPLVTVGEPVFYTITVFNEGPSAATQVVVEDVLPSQVSYQSSNRPCANLSGTLHCSLPNIPANSSFVLQIEGFANAPGEAVNSASVSSYEDDSDPSDNDDTAETEITQADLALTKDLPTCVDPPATFDYILVITNNGPSLATGITLVDTLPAELTYVSANNAACTLGGGNVLTCSVGNLSNGNSVTVRITVSAPNQERIVTNSASVSADQYDPPATNNNSDTLQTDIHNGCP
ncbi:MAG: TadE/TadG family type IV pilus assembly protein [Candidatus Promineifilaceae bacterium]